MTTAAGAGDAFLKRCAPRSWSLMSSADMGKK